MTGYLGLGIGAGLVSALLFAVIVTGSAPGMLLCYLAPVPILIVALGWTHLLGLLGASVGGLVLSLALTSRAGLAYGIGAGFPAWWLAYAAWRQRLSDPEGRVSPDRLLVWTAVTASAVSLASTIGLGRGDYAAFYETVHRLTSAMLRSQLAIPSGQPLPPIAGMPGTSFVSALVAIAPAVATAVFTVVTVLNLWLAGRALVVSGRFGGAWTALYHARMPGLAIGLLGAGLLVGLAPGFVGVGGASLAGGLLMAFALQGLALIHAATAGRPGRGGALGLAYILILFAGGAILPLLALLGLADSATPLRSRLVRETPDGPPGRPPFSNP